MGTGFKGLMVYQKAYAAVLEVYKETSRLPAQEQYGLSSQIRRAAVSVAANIAEGYAKKNHAPADYKRFLLMSSASANETMVLAGICSDVGFLPPEFKVNIENQYSEITKMLFGIINKL